MSLNNLAILICFIDEMYCQDKGRVNGEYVKGYNLMTYKPAFTETHSGKKRLENLLPHCKWHEKWYHYILVVSRS